MKATATAASPAPHHAADSAERSHITTASSQLTCTQASSFAFTAFIDLMPRSEDRDAVATTDSRASLSYASLHRLLAEMPMLGASRICLALPDSAEAVTALLACACQAACSPLNRSLGAAELSFELTDLPASAVVVQHTDHLAPRVLDAAGAQGVPALHLVGSDVRAGAFTLEWAARPLLCAAAAVASRRDDICLALYSSGTTAKPKVVPLSHENVAVGALCVASTLRLQRCDVGLSMMPLCHAHCMSVDILPALLSAARVVATPGFDAALAVGWLRSAGTTWYGGVPSMHLRLAEAVERSQPARGGGTLRLVRNCSAALLPSVAERLEAALVGCTVMPTYALAASLPITSNPRGGGRVLRSVGAAAGPEVRLVRDDGTPRAAGGVGDEVCVHGACVTVGYEVRTHMAADPNAAAFHLLEGSRWLRTGDRGRVDGAGCLLLSGRFGARGKRDAEAASAPEVEGALRARLALGVVTLDNELLSELRATPANTATSASSGGGDVGVTVH